MKKISLLLVFCFAFSLIGSAKVIYVQKKVFYPIGIQLDGTSWEKAYKTLQVAINNASSGDEIWVAAGIYKPSLSGGGGTGVMPLYSNDCAFVLKPNVKIYGGFTGNETSLAQRDVYNNTTILSGFLQEGKILGSIIIPEIIAHHVVISAGDVENSVLDGFTIQGGKTASSGSIIVNGQTIDNNRGAGIYLSNSSPTLKNLKIIHNEAFAYGGGIYALGSNSNITNVLIQNNTAFEGGGIYLVASPNTLTLTNVEISNNTATYGGGICNASCSLTLVNATIAGNDGYYGGGLYNYMGTPAIRNSIIYGNIGTQNTSGILESDCYYSLVHGVTTTGTNNNILGSTNPRFVNASVHNYRLSTSPILSPCIGSGYNNYNNTYYDLDGNLRIRGFTIDMGAYESGNGTKSFSGQNENSLESEVNPEIELNVFPNPVNSNQQINISLGKYDKPVDVKVYSLEGKLIHNKTYESGSFGIHVPDLAPGIYMIHLQSQEGERFTKKILVN